MTTLLSSVNLTWLTSTQSDLWHVVTSAVCVYAVTILLVRINGLRTFSKMSSFDFPVTVAIGSIMASTIVSDSPSVTRGCIAIAALILLQFIVAALRRASSTFEGASDNCPVLLMEGPNILYENLSRERVTTADLRAKLREANVIRLEQIRAVVLEATGEISVLHCDDPAIELESELLKGVARD